MSILDIHDETGGASGPALVGIPSTPGERFGAAWDAALNDPSRYFNVEGRRRELWQDAADKLYQATGEKLPVPNALYRKETTEELERHGYNRTAVNEARQQAIIDRYRALQQESGVSADLPDPERIEQQIAEEGRSIRGRAQSLVDTGNGVAGFLGGMAAPTPENILGLLVPPSRAVLGASTVGNSFLRSLGREAIYQGVTQGAISGAAGALDQGARGEFSGRALAGDVLEGMLGGALVGGAFHTVFHGPKALWERWQGLKPEVRENAPLEVKDAMRVIEKDVLYSDQNRLNLPWDVHERYQGRALDAIMRNTPVVWGDLRPGDTPMTAVATALRRPEGVNIVGLNREFGRLSSIGDADLEAVVRETKPQAFKPLDVIDEKLRALDEREKAIREEAQQIGPADVTDFDTASILYDIDAKLQQKLLRRAVREQLEHERRQWLETLDAHGGLSDELQKMRTEFFPEHGPALKRIAEEREGLMRDREQARQEVQREVDFLRGKLDKLKTGEPKAPKEIAAEAGFKAPEDMAQALHRAEFNRYVSALREVLPAEEPKAEAMPIEKPEKPGQPKVEQAEADVSGLLKGRSASDARKELLAELEQHEQGAKESDVIKACAGVGNG